MSVKDYPLFAIAEKPKSHGSDSCVTGAPSSGCNV